jgi:nucleoside 2-deoxyribosyltransferase
MPRARSRTASTQAFAKRPRAYLAGPDVFLEHVAAIAASKKRLCAAYGMEGVFPLDGAMVDRRRSPASMARAIGAANEALIRECDLVIANCSPFRGVSMDAGTAYEIGYARALGKPVFGYTNILADYKRRADRYRRLGDPLRADAVNSAIEDFGLAENLMISTAMVTRDLVRTRVKPGRELVDQRGFARCLALAAKAMTTASRRRRVG